VDPKTMERGVGTPEPVGHRLVAADRSLITRWRHLDLVDNRFQIAIECSHRHDFLVPSVLDMLNMCSRQALPSSCSSNPLITGTQVNVLDQAVRPPATNPQPG